MEEVTGLAELSIPDYAIVSCGTIRPELEYLEKNGELVVAKILYTTPGLHQEPRELAEQLGRQITRAKKYAKKIIVVYGGNFCYVNLDDPYDHIDAIIDRQREEGYHLARIDAERCFDMLTSAEEREHLAAGEKVWWLTPGWVVYRHLVFKGWDKAQANENFPRHTGGAVLLDGIGFFDQYSLEHPEELLDFGDWMGLPIRPQQVSLDRFQGLILEQVQKIEAGG